MVKHRILLADDSVTIQKVVNLTFADEGIQVVTVGDGDSAMQKFVESVPDLVMVDVNMPGVDGYRICEMIKQDDETKHIPVILLVGSFEPFDEEEARRVGADDFLTKPFQSIRQLVNKVSDLLSGKRNTAFGDKKIAGSFADTLELLPSPDKRKTTAIFDDTDLDDEMIQTNQIGSLPVNEAQKFESAPEPQTTNENIDLDFETESVVEESNIENETTDKNSTEENRDEIEDALTENKEENQEFLPRHENIYEFADEQELADEQNSPEAIETEEVNRNMPEGNEVDQDTQEFPHGFFSQETESQANPVEETPINQVEKDEVSANFETTQEFELDDFDLLELPQSKKLKSQKTGSGSVMSPAGNLSPEDIEAVADKVVEKLSDQVIKRIVREVFAQMTKNK